MDIDDSIDTVINTTLLEDASKDYGFPYLELTIEGIRLKNVRTSTTNCFDISVDSVKSFVFNPFQFMPDLLEENYSYCSGDKSVNSGYEASSSMGTFVREIQQVVVISGPEPYKIENNGDVAPLFAMTIQYPLSPDAQPHPPIFFFKMRELKFCFDPLLFNWLIYKPRCTTPHSASTGN